jgi:hypothetical protein
MGTRQRRAVGVNNLARELYPTGMESEHNCNKGANMTGGSMSKTSSIVIENFRNGAAMPVYR